MLPQQVGSAIRRDCSASTSTPCRPNWYRPQAGGRGICQPGRRSLTKTTASRSKTRRVIENYAHAGKERANNPPVGLVTPDTDPERGRKRLAHNPHLDPQISWSGKAEHTSFEVPTVSLHMHERIDPCTVVEAVRRRNGGNQQLSLFEAPEENPPIRQAIEFYRHRHNWSNRLIAGDSLLVMNSLLEKEGLGGQVQMVYIDPPYYCSSKPNKLYTFLF